MRTWEFSYLFRAGCVLCCVPTKVSKCPDELADFTGDCSAALGPSFGGAVFCLPAPRTRPGSLCPWPFQLPLALRSPVGLSQDSGAKWQG